MPASVSDDVFAGLRTIDTPTITNVVATYPKNPLCLGLYNPWTEAWYTDASIRCIYPEKAPVIGNLSRKAGGPCSIGRLLGAQSHG